jgi:hypothetical protein
MTASARTNPTLSDSVANLTAVRVALHWAARGGGRARTKAAAPVRAKHQLSDPACRQPNSASAFGLMRMGGEGRTKRNAFVRTILFPSDLRRPTRIKTEQTPERGKEQRYET